MFLAQQLQRNPKGLWSSQVEVTQQYELVIHIVDPVLNAFKFWL